jgi:hypothetical protein
MINIKTLEQYYEQYPFLDVIEAGIVLTSSDWLSMNDEQKALYIIAKRFYERYNRMILSNILCNPLQSFAEIGAEFTNGKTLILYENYKKDMEDIINGRNK